MHASLSNVLYSPRRVFLANSWYEWPMSVRVQSVHHSAMKRTVVWLTDKQTKTLTQLSGTTLAPVSAIIRQAVQEYIDRRKKRGN